MQAGDAPSAALAAKEAAKKETDKLVGHNCVRCLNEGNRYCFIKFTKK